jgi:hypothetical protein
VNRKTNKKSKQKSNETGVGKKLSPAPARVNTRLHRGSSFVANDLQNHQSPMINLHHREARVIKYPAEEHISDSKEDIKKAQPEKTRGKHTKKAAPQHRRLV